MKWIILFFSLTLMTTNNVENQLVVEYGGGVPYTIWVTLKLKKNGKYEYSVATHQRAYTKDKGKWEYKDNQLVLNSSKKIKKRVSGKKIGKAKLLFKNFKFNYENDRLEYGEENEFNFSETYFNLLKINHAR